MELREELAEVVKKTAIERDGRMTLACAEGFAIAERFRVARREIGRICNENDIKIVRCQMGCFD